MNLPAALNRLVRYGAIGTIAAIWRREEGVTETIGMTARKDMVGAALSCYGSRTNIVLYN